MIVNHPVLGRVSVPNDVPLDQIENYLIEKYADTSETKSALAAFGSQLKEGISSSFRGIKSAVNGRDEDSFVREFENRLELEKYPVAGMAGLLTGSILDPVTLPVAALKPIKLAGTVGTMAARGTAAGAFGGLTEPVFEEFGDSTLRNVGYGAGFGAVLGGGAGALAKRMGVGLDDASSAGQKELNRLEEERAGQPQKPIEEEVPEILEEATPARTLEELDAELNALPNVKESAKFTIEEIKQPFISRAGNALEEADAENLRLEVDSLTRRLENAEKASRTFDQRAAGGTKKSRAKLESESKILADRVKETQVRLDRLNEQLKAHNEAMLAKQELDRIEAGKLTKAENDKIQADKKSIKEARERLKQAKKEATIKDVPQPKAKLEVPEIKEEPIPLTPEAQAEAKAEELINQPDDVPAAQDPLAAAVNAVNGTSAPTPVLRSGLSPRGTSMGAMEVPPASKFAERASEGLDEPAFISAASSTGKVDDADIPSFPDRGEPMPKVFKKAKAYLASKGVLARIAKVNNWDEAYGFEAIEQRAKRLEREIGENYDSLVDYVFDRIDSSRGQFDAVEKVLLEPLFKEASQKILSSMSEVNRLRRAGELDSPEGLRAVQEFQLYNYLSMVELNDKRATSAALRQYKKMKGITNRQSAQVKNKKPVNDLFGGVKCG